MKRSNSTRPAPTAASGTTWSGNVRAVSFVVFGQMYSMKNSKRGHFKHEKALRFEQDFALQVPPGARLGIGSRKELLRATVTVWYPSWRQDVDFALIYDLLQRTGVVSNDRWIRQRAEFAEVDPANPRCEITVEAI